jgi:hypothetical protein
MQVKKIDKQMKTIASVARKAPPQTELIAPCFNLIAGAKGNPDQ